MFVLFFILCGIIRLRDQMVNRFKTSETRSVRGLNLQLIMKEFIGSVSPTNLRIMKP